MTNTDRQKVDRRTVCHEEATETQTTGASTVGSEWSRSPLTVRVYTRIPDTTYTLDLIFHWPACLYSKITLGILKI